MDFELQNSKLIASKENTEQTPIPVDNHFYKKYLLYYTFIQKPLLSHYDSEAIIGELLKLFEFMGLILYEKIFCEIEYC